MNNRNGKSTESWSVQRKPRLNVKKDGTTDLYVVDGEGKDIVWCGWESKVPFNGICCFPPNVAEKAALIAADPEMLKMLKHNRQIASFDGRHSGFGYRRRRP